jgi:hypothetical protein
VPAAAVCVAVEVVEVLPLAEAAGAVDALPPDGAAPGAVVTLSVVLATVVVPDSIVLSPSLVYPSIMQISTQARAAPDL